MPMTLQELLDAITAKRKANLATKLIEGLNDLTQRQVQVKVFNTDGTINSASAKALLEGILLGTGEAGLPAFVDVKLEQDTLDRMEEKTRDVAAEEGVQVT